MLSVFLLCLISCQKSLRTGQEAGPIISSLHPIKDMFRPIRVTILHTKKAAMEWFLFAKACDASRAQGCRRFASDFLNVFSSCPVPRPIPRGRYRSKILKIALALSTLTLAEGQECMRNMHSVSDLKKREKNGNISTKQARELGAYGGRNS